MCPVADHDVRLGVVEVVAELGLGQRAAFARGRDRVGEVVREVVRRLGRADDPVVRQTVARAWSRERILDRQAVGDQCGIRS